MDAIEMLLGRESAVRLEGPGPDQKALDVIIQSAVRAPDHGRMRPWRFIVIPEAARERFGEVMAQYLLRREPNATPELLERERKKALRAPLIVAVAAEIKSTEKISAFEQTLAAGAAAENMMLAAHALGFGAMWKTGDVSEDPQAKQALGLDPGATIVGFIYLGTRVGGSTPFPRPVASDYVTVWNG